MYSGPAHCDQLDERLCRPGDTLGKTENPWTALPQGVDYTLIVEPAVPSYNWT